MNLIIETDLGGDPDDFFALLYLISAGVNIRTIALSPGYPNQVAIARMICEETQKDIPISSHKLPKKVIENNGFHKEVLDRHGYIQHSEPDVIGIDCIENAFHVYHDSEILIMGPPISFNSYFKAHPDVNIKRATMMGGFIGYDEHRLPCRRLKKFEGKKTYVSFNPNGSIDGTLRLLEADVNERRFVSKNVTHTVFYDKRIHGLFSDSPPRNRAMELFRDCMKYYLNSHGSKKFHDPAAAVCHLHPEIAVWVKAGLYHVKNQSAEWGAKLNENGDFITIDIDRKEIWKYLINGK